MNVFQHGVLNGLGWVAILTDGWIVHSSGWLSGIGIGLIVWSMWAIYKDL
jgi:hypothetical protein